MRGILTSRPLVSGILFLAALPLSGALLPNGNFEGTGKNDGVEFWVKAVTDGTMAEASPNEGESGTRALTVFSPKTDAERWFLKKSVAIPIVAGKRYEFTVLGKAAGADFDDNTRLEIRWIGPTGDGVGTTSGSSYVGNFPWKSLRVVGNAPATATGAIPSMVVGCGENVSAPAYRVIFDDAQFAEATESGNAPLPGGRSPRSVLKGGFQPESKIWPLLTPFAEWAVPDAKAIPGGDALSITPVEEVVRIVPPSRLILPAGTRRLQFWTTAIPASVVFVICDSEDREHRVSARVAIPAGHKPGEAEGWPVWNLVTSGSFGMPTEEDIAARVVPEFQERVRNAVWSGPLKLVSIEIRLAPSALATFWMASPRALVAPELSADYGWFNQTAGRVGWGNTDILFASDFSLAEGAFRYEVEMQEGYQGPVVWRQTGEAEHFRNDPLAMASPVAIIPQVPAKTYFLTLKSWNPDGSLREEHRIQYYVLRNRLKESVSRENPGFSLDTGAPGQVLPAGTKHATMKVTGASSGQVLLRVFDWKKAMVFEEIRSASGDLTFQIPVSDGMDYYATVDLLGNGAVLDRARLHFGVHSPIDEVPCVLPDSVPCSTAPTVDASLVAEYTRPWFSKRFAFYPDWQWEEPSNLSGYDIWLRDQALPRGFLHVSNLYPWSDTEVLPGVFRWVEGDRRTRMAAEAGASVTAWFGTLGDWPPHTPDWWGGDILLTQNGWPHVERDGSSAARNPTPSYWYAEKEGYLNWIHAAVTHLRSNPDITQYKVLMQSFVESSDSYKENVDYLTSDYSTTFERAFLDWSHAGGSSLEALPQPLVIPGAPVAMTGPDLSKSWGDFVQFKIHSSLERLGEVLSTIRKLDPGRPVYVYRGPRTHPATEAAVPILKNNNAYFFDEGAPNFFSNALASMCVQGGVRYGSENHFYTPGSREIIDTNIFYGTIYNQGWYFSYRWHERFKGPDARFYDALDFLGSSLPVIKSYAAAQSEFPQVLVFGSRIDQLVNHDKLNFYARISGVDIFSALFSYFQVLPHFASEYVTWTRFQDFKAVFVCGEVMTREAIQRVVDFAKGGGKVVVIGQAGRFCAEAPGERDLLERSLKDMPSVRYIREPYLPAPPPGMSPETPLQPSPEEIESVLAWAGVVRPVMLKKEGNLDTGFECLIRKIDDRSFYVGVQRRFVEHYSSIMVESQNLEKWGRTATTVCLPSVPAKFCRVEKIHRTPHPVSPSTGSDGSLEFKTDEALTGELQIYKVTVGER